jgi:hypothetical protein
VLLAEVPPAETSVVVAEAVAAPAFAPAPPLPPAPAPLLAPEPPLPPAPPVALAVLLESPAALATALAGPPTPPLPSQVTRPSTLRRRRPGSWSPRITPPISV